MFLSVRSHLAGWPRFSVGRLIELIRHKPDTFFSKSVHHLFLDNLTLISQDMLPDSTITTILFTCCGVTDLFMNLSNAPTMPIICGLPSLRRLAVSIDKLFQSLPLDFTHSLFRHLTHLEVFDSVGTAPEMWDGLSLIPNLTHFGFHAESFLDISARIMETCKKLQHLIVVIHFEEDATGMEVGHKCEALAEDPRFVAIMRFDFPGEWQLGAYYGTDFWSRSEAFVALKLDRRVDRLQYLCKQNRPWSDTEEAV